MTTKSTAGHTPDTDRLYQPRPDGFATVPVNIGYKHACKLEAERDRLRESNAGLLAALARRDALLRETLDLLRVTDNFGAMRLCKRIILELSDSASQGRKK